MTDTPTSHLVENMKAARGARGWSQRDLVRELNRRGLMMNQTTLSRIENEEREARISEASTIASALGTTVEALMADPGVFASTLEWTKVQGEFRDARQRLQEAADQYEEAARAMLAELPYAPSGIIEETRQALDISARRSCVEVAWRQYKGHRTGRTGEDTREEDLSVGDVVRVLNMLENNHRPGAHNHRPTK